jgi:hypothetical protein
MDGLNVSLSTLSFFLWAYTGFLEEVGCKSGLTFQERYVSSLLNDPRHQIR